MSGERLSRVVAVVSVLLGVVAVEPPMLAQASPFGTATIQPSGSARPCREDETFDYVNFCNGDFEPGDTTVCFGDSFPESLPPGETRLRMLKSSQNFTTDGIWGGTDFFELYFVATSLEERKFSATLDLSFLTNCDGAFLRLPSMCTVVQVGSENVDDPNEWTSRTLVNGSETWPPLWLEEPSKMSIRFNITYDDSYSQLPRIGLNVQFGPCPRPPVRRAGGSLDLEVKPSDDFLPLTGGSVELIPIGVLMIGIGFAALRLRRGNIRRASFDT